jgi:hypothetical protein
MESARGGRAIDYAEVEQKVAESLAELERAAHQEMLRGLEVDAPRVKIGGKTHWRVGHAPGTYCTMAGPVTVMRALYRASGVRNAKVVDAISLRAGAFGRGWLPKTAQAMAHSVQQGTSREAEVMAEQLARLPYSRASFERVTHELGEEWLAHHADIEDELVQGIQVPENVHAVSMALDRVSIPMEEEAKRPRGRPRKDAPNRPVTREFRMGYCGTVTLHDAEGSAVYTFRYGCMPHSDPSLLCEGMANDIYRLMEQRPDLRLVQLADGAPEMWKLLQGALTAEMFGDITQLVDFWHVIEKLAPAAKVIYGDDHAAALHRWKQLLRQRCAAAAEILDELRLSGCERSWLDGKQPVHEAITYIENHGDHMNYASARRKHLPIGSGNVEATCKTLVGVRMKRAGSRWHNDTGEHILRLRALALSDRWQPAMNALHATRRTAVRVAA